MNKNSILLIILIILIVGLLLLINYLPSEKAKFYSLEESKAIAENWIKNQSPTYLFDGSNLQLVESRALDLVDCQDCYEFDHSFESSQAGYGNREGEMLAQVITPHLITVWVEKGEVVKALTDDKFDEIKGEEIKEEPLNVQKVSLFFYDKEKDKSLPPEGQISCSQEAIVPVERIVRGENPALDALDLLFREEERKEESHLTNELARTGLYLESLSLEDGVLTIEIPEVPGVTSGGSCQMNIYRSQIEKTALQFPEIQEIRFEPESLFQP